MKFVIIISVGPLNKQRSNSAFQFAKACLEKGHTLSQIFFYQEGVNHSIDKKSSSIWQQLANQSKFKLTLCSASTLRRGLSKIPPLFKLSGLSYLIESISEADRVVTFTP